MYPDTSDVLDAPQTGKHEFYPKGGTTVEQIKASGGSMGALDWDRRAPGAAVPN